MNLTPNATATHWSAQYVGEPWRPEFNCWDLVCAVQGAWFNRPMLRLDIGSAEPTAENWQSLRTTMAGSIWKVLEGRGLEAAAEGDILLMRGPDGPHVGVVVANGSVSSLLHNLGGMLDGEPRGSVRIDPLASISRLGYGRFEVWRAVT